MWWLIQKIWKGIKIIFECLFNCLGSVGEGVCDIVSGACDSFDGFGGGDGGGWGSFGD
jgi:hypothetical protein